jgi:hypothetical protein
MFTSTTLELHFTFTILFNQLPVFTFLCTPSPFLSVLSFRLTMASKPKPEVDLQQRVSNEHDYDEAHSNLKHSESHPGVQENVDDSPSSDNTATNSSDEFDWDKDEESPAQTVHRRAKRGRALYLAFLKLARPIRTLLVGTLGCGILITPLIVVHLKFRSSPARPHVRAWSIWLSIVWAAACLTYIFVDAIPRIALSTLTLCGGHVQTLKIQLEVYYFYYPGGPQC